MKKVILLIFLVGVSVCQTEADHAGNLLEQLHQESLDNLADFNQNWAEQSAVLQDTAQEWTNNLNAQQEECDAADSDRDGAFQREQDNADMINYLGTTIRDITDKYNKIFVDRCTANRNYIQGLKNDKILISLVEFLRQALQSTESLNLVQRQQLITKFTQFMALYKSKDSKKLLQMHLQLKQDGNQISNQDGVANVPDSQDYNIDNQFDVNQRTDEEVGQGHVDENRDNIELDNFESGTRRPFSEYKAELLQLLDDMEVQISNKIDTQQEDEVNAGIAAAEYRIQLEKEMQELDAELYRQSEYAISISRKVREFSARSNQCQNTLENVQQGHDQAQSVLQEARTKYEAKKGELTDESEVFAYVVGLYNENIQGSDYKEQLDDYIADGTYDQTYENREVDQFEVDSNNNSN